MVNIMFFATLALNLAGFLAAGIFLWINIFGDFADLEDRNKSIFKISTASMILSLVFAFLTSLLSHTDRIEEAIEQSAVLFTIIAITWLVILVACCVVMLISVVSKKYFRATNASNVYKILKIALPGGIIAMVFTWLLS